jgi:tetratricopeptide (TPR) repeat protein
VAAIRWLRVPGWISGGIAPVLLFSGCAGRPVRLVVVTSSVALTVSLLGDTLYSVPLDPALGPARVKRISAARAEVARSPTDLKAQLRLARSTAAMGRLRDAVEILSSAAEIHFEDPRVYRQRGEILLRLRQLDLAIGDLRKSGLLAIGMGPFPEAPESPGVSGPPITTMQFQTSLLLGVALYCRGDYPAARQALAEAAVGAITADDRARAVLWLFYAVRRIEDGAGAPGVLSLVQPDWADNSRIPEAALLLAFKGLLPSDTIRRRALSAEGEERAVYSYGIGYYLLLLPERKDEGELWLERARSGPDWISLAYLAAEADLARMRGVKRGK